MINKMFTLFFFVPLISHAGDGHEPKLLHRTEETQATRLQIQQQSIQLLSPDAFKIVTGFNFEDPVPVHLLMQIKIKVILAYLKSDEALKKFRDKKIEPPTIVEDGLKALEDLDHWYGDQNKDFQKEHYIEYRNWHNLHLLLLHRARLMQDLESLSTQPLEHPPEQQYIRRRNPIAKYSKMNVTKEPKWLGANVPYEPISPDHWERFANYQIAEEKLGALEIVNQSLDLILDDINAFEILLENLGDVSEELHAPTSEDLQAQAASFQTMGEALEAKGGLVSMGLAVGLSSLIQNTADQYADLQEKKYRKGPFRSKIVRTIGGDKVDFEFDPKLLDLQYYRTFGVVDPNSYHGALSSSPADLFLKDLGITEWKPTTIRNSLAYEYNYPHLQGATFACNGFGIADDMEYAIKASFGPEVDLSPWYTDLMLHASCDGQGWAEPFLYLWLKNGKFREGIKDLKKAVSGLANNPTCANMVFDPNSPPCDYPNSARYFIEDLAFMEVSDETPDLGIDFNFFRALIDNRQPPVITIATDQIEETENWIRLLPAKEYRDEVSGQYFSGGHTLIVTGYDAEGEVDPFDGIKKPFLEVRDSLRFHKAPYRVSAHSLVNHVYTVLKIKKVGIKTAMPNGVITQPIHSRIIQSQNFYRQIKLLKQEKKSSSYFETVNTLHPFAEAILPFKQSINQ